MDETASTTQGRRSVRRGSSNRAPRTAVAGHSPAKVDPAPTPQNAVRHTHISQTLRDEIVSGQRPPGSRLPTHLQLAERFRTTSTTVQKALDHLARTEFIIARGRLGTLVTDNPPHLSRYAFVYATDPADTRSWTQVFEAFRREAHEFSSHRAGMKIVDYYNIDGRRPPAEDYQRLLGDVQDRRLAGIIFTSPPPESLAQSPVITSPYICRSVSAIAAIPGIPTIGTDLSSFIARAMDFLQSHGRRRIAVMSIGGATGDDTDAASRMMREAARARALEIRPHWLLPIHPNAPFAARQIAHLLMLAAPDQRPDGLIITNDRLVEQATTGLIAAGVHVPDDLLVVARTNYPWPPPAHLPVTRLGFDMRRIVHALIDAVDQQRQGKNVPPCNFVGPEFEDELQTRGAVISRRVD